MSYTPDDILDRIAEAAREVVRTQATLPPLHRPVAWRPPVDRLRELLAALDIARGLRDGYLGAIGVRDPAHPCEDYLPGPVVLAATCETDGHYLCIGCQWNAKSHPHRPTAAAPPEEGRTP